MKEIWFLGIPLGLCDTWQDDALLEIPVVVTNSPELKNILRTTARFQLRNVKEVLSILHIEDTMEIRQDLTQEIRIKNPANGAIMRL